MKRTVVSAVQFSIEPMNVEKNLSRAHHWITKSKEVSGADLVVLPESFTTGFTPIGGIEALWKAVSTIPGPLTDMAVQWARELDMYICFPTYERGEVFPVIYNSAALIGPDGLLGVYRKTHPFPSERLEVGGWTTPGREPFSIETSIGNIGVVICYDGDFPELARVTALKGAEIICRPSAFLRTFDQWELTNRARAYDNHVYWIGTNSVGRDASGACFFGCSMIVHPSGMKLSQAGGCDEFIYVELDPDPIKKIIPGSNRDQTFDHIQDRNTEAYTGILEEGKSVFEPARRIPFRRG
jgi:predicted amidohydrolase